MNTQSRRRAAALSILAFLGTLTSAAKAEPAAVPEALMASPPGCISIDSPAAQKDAIGARLYEQMVMPAVKRARPESLQSVPNYFAPDLQRLAQENIFEAIWGRCGLSRRDRSLLTLGILIALRADNELRYHFPIALTNGLSRAELEEVIYHASAYAGMPAAVSARIVAQDVLPDE